ncbi:L-seryl-tRNA(Sec) kinase isoform X1 [Falco cherrug]|uniref:L-seryl-tRNA(Sec) kinase isoform X1 n=1 Tax=Falco cherrug TaxID=345164 RepID=UPI00247AE2DE|nr:L-seryl-tRNA(Sec) kinase isoform X1 [Falco cherrug]
MRRAAAVPDGYRAGGGAGGGGGAAGRRRARAGGAVRAGGAAGRRQVHAGPRPAPPPAAAPGLGLRAAGLRRADPAGGLPPARAGGGAAGQCGSPPSRGAPSALIGHPRRRSAASLAARRPLPGSAARPGAEAGAEAWGAAEGQGRGRGSGPGERRRAGRAAGGRGAGACRRAGAWGVAGGVGAWQGCWSGAARALTPRCLPPQPPCWKRSRRELLQCLERVLRALLGEDPQAAPAPPAAWHRLLACCQRQGLLCPPEGQAGPGPCWAPPGTSRPLYLILDDNFYYQSMRYEVYQLARKYSLSFCQLFLECPLECCLQRNCLRSRPVPDQTIYLMARKIEMPDPKKNAWEQNSLILKSLDGAPEDDEQIISLLATALENPVKQNEEDTEQKEADRAICAASAVHQADQTCRRIISQAMKDAKDKNILPSEMKSLAEELNKLKAELLEDLRQGNNLKKQICIQNQYSDPAASFISAFQHGASNVVNKYILK